MTKKFTQAASTHIGYTSREVKSSVNGYEFTVPAGTLCRKLSTHWVVEDLTWLAKQEGERALQQVPSLKGRSVMELGCNSMSYHDADHYGITVSESDLERIEPKQIAGY